MESGRKGKVRKKMVIELTAKENIKLEKLSSEISREHSIFKSILESYSSVYQVSQERRIIAMRNYGKIC